MADELILDEQQVFTGCIQHPVGKVCFLPVFEDVGPMLTMVQIEAIAKAGTARGKDRFDSSYITSQGNAGSCNGHAGAGALSRARVRRGLSQITLSGAYLYSLINGGRDSGSMLEDGMAAMQSRGIATVATVPPTSIYPSRYDKAKADAEAARFKGFECYAVNTQQGLFSALASDFDCVVALCANNAFMQLDSRGVAQGGNGQLNHAVAADGLWWDRELIADGYNSWGTGFGISGRMGLTWNQHFQYSYQDTTFYAIRSALDDPQGDNPPVIS